MLCVVKKQGKAEKFSHPFTFWPEENSFSISEENYFFAVRVTKHCHRLPREVVDSPSMVIFKSCLDMVQTTCSWWLCLSRLGGPDDLQRSLLVYTTLIL